VRTEQGRPQSSGHLFDRSAPPASSYGERRGRTTRGYSTVMMRSIPRAKCASARNDGSSSQPKLLSEIELRGSSQPIDLGHSPSGLSPAWQGNPSVAASSTARRFESTDDVSASIDQQGADHVEGGSHWPLIFADFRTRSREGGSEQPRAPGRAAQDEGEGRSGNVDRPESHRLRRDWMRRSEIILIEGIWRSVTRVRTSW